MTTLALCPTSRKALGAAVPCALRERGPRGRAASPVIYGRPGRPARRL